MTWLIGYTCKRSNTFSEVVLIIRGLTDFNFLLAMQVIREVSL